MGRNLGSHGGQRSNRGAEGKAERFPHRGSVLTSTHQPERLVCSPAGTGGGWELRLRLRSDAGRGLGLRREHSLKGLVHHGYPGRIPGESLELLKNKRLFLASFAGPDLLPDSLLSSCGAVAPFRLCSRSQPQSSPWDLTSEAGASALRPRLSRWVSRQASRAGE